MDLLRPEGGGGLVIAGPEIATLVLAALANAWLMLYKAWLMREFVTGQNLGRWRQWLKALAKFPLATLAMALLSQTTKYTQARISLLWRRAATRRLMRGYFSRMNYYKLLHHGGVRIEDTDVRICSDVRSACDALTGVLIGGLSGCTMSLFSSWALYWRRGLLAVFLPYLYSFIIVPLNFVLTSPDWGVIMQVQKAFSAYQQALTRTQFYGEGVAMLRGEDFERGHLDRQAAGWAAAERASWDALACFEWFQQFICNPAMPGIWQTVASFGASFIALRAAGPGRAVLNPWEPNEAVVYEYGANISDFWQVFYGVRGASTLMSALDNFKRSSLSLVRIEQLQDALAQLDREAETAAASSLADGDSIAFEDVSVVTPTGMKLIAGLTFKVEPGENLLICGHNGAGKSSIFRCLGGLWPVAQGCITCPHNGSGEGGLFGAVYYLPQKPTNILGTLSDQLTYPARVPGGLPEHELRRWLSYVGIDYLVDAAAKAGTLNEESDWAMQLSLGEQQRLGIARVLYHRPRFAILDECTSAVSKDTERWLFEVANALGISCVTITHRPALQEHHHQMLRLTGTLQEDGRGWELSTMATGLPPARPRAASESEVHARVAELLQSQGRQKAVVGGSGGHPTGSGLGAATPAAQDDTDCGLLAARVLRRWPSAPQRIAAALQLDRMSGVSKARLAVLLGCMLIRPQASWEVYRTIGGSVGLAMCNDSVGLCAELSLNVAYAIVLACLDRFAERLSRWIMLDLWRQTVDSLHRQALDGAAFHRMQSERLYRVEHPLQRISEARALLDELKGQLSSTAGLAIQMLYFLPLLIRGGGPLPAVTLAGLYATHLAVRTYWMPNFKAITAKHSDFEERFQVAQTRMRHVAEPVAFSGGGETERQRVEEHFERLCDHRLGSMRQEFTYNFLTEFFIMYDNLPIWFHRMLSFNFAWRNVPIGGASPASAVQNYLYDRTISVSLVGVQALTAFPAELAKMDSRAQRLLELREALDLVHRPPELAEGEDRLVVKDLDLVTPKGVRLVSGLTFEVERGDPLLVTGPNACGKTALARVLLGLWRSSGDDAVVAPPRSLMIVPQQPYLAPGCLGDQVTYPKRFVPGTDDERALAALDAAGVGYLLERSEHSWGHQCAWEEVLSGGEQQRVTLARVFFHRPGFALLDECTSMVAVDAEERLYRAAIEDFGITPLTFSQRLFLPQLHRRELRLGDGSAKGWSLECGARR